MTAVISMGTSRFIVLAFIAPLSKKITSHLTGTLASLRWSGTERSVSPRHACTRGEGPSCAQLFPVSCRACERSPINAWWVRVVQGPGLHRGLHL